MGKKAKRVSRAASGFTPGDMTHVFEKRGAFISAIQNHFTITNLGQDPKVIRSWQELAMESESGDAVEEEFNEWGETAERIAAAVVDTGLPMNLESAEKVWGAGLADGTPKQPSDIRPVAPPAPEVDPATFVPYLRAYGEANEKRKGYTDLALVRSLTDEQISDAVAGATSERGAVRKLFKFLGSLDRGVAAAEPTPEQAFNEDPGAFTEADPGTLDAANS